MRVVMQSISHTPILSDIYEVDSQFANISGLILKTIQHFGGQNIGIILKLYCY